MTVRLQRWPDLCALFHQRQHHRNPAGNILRALCPAAHRALIGADVTRESPLGHPQAGQSGAEVWGGHGLRALSNVASSQRSGLVSA